MLAAPQVAPSLHSRALLPYPAASKKVHFNTPLEMAAVGSFPPPPPGPPPGYTSSSTYLPYVPSPPTPQQSQPQQAAGRPRGASDSYYSNHPNMPHPSPYQQSPLQQQYRPPYPPPSASQQQLVVQPQQARPAHPRRHHSHSPRPISRGQRLGAAAAGAVATTVLDKYLIEGHLGGGGSHHSGHGHHDKREDEHNHHTIRRLADLAIGAYAGTEALKQYEKRKSPARKGSRSNSNEFYGESHNDLLHPNHQHRGRTRGMDDQYLSPPPTADHSPYHATYWNNAAATGAGADADYYGGRARSFDDGERRRGGGDRYADNGYYSDDDYERDYDGRRRRSAPGDRNDNGGGATGDKKSHFKRDLAGAAIAALVGQQAGKLSHHGRDRSPGKHAAEGALVWGVAKELLGSGLGGGGGGKGGRRSQSGRR